MPVPRVGLPTLALWVALDVLLAYVVLRGALLGWAPPPVVLAALLLPASSAWTALLVRARRR